MFELKTIEKAAGDLTYRMCLRIPAMGLPRISFQVLRKGGGREVWCTIPRAWRNTYAEVEVAFSQELVEIKLT